MSGVPYRVWTGSEWIEVDVPEMGGEAIVVPNVAGLVYRGADRREILLQRRDKEGEIVRGLWELPGGRWRAGETAVEAVAREVREETGIELTAVSAAAERLDTGPGVAFGVARPLAVVNGIEGAYPSLHVLFECRGEGDPRPLVGETADPQWITVAAVVDMLRERPDQFVWQTQAMLRAVFGG
ncbi:MAG: NUDIX hydrolase [Acidimicrobiia bacterium]